VFSLTAPGTVKGKLSYLSPEVTLGKPATPQSDVFAMGSVLWEALSGMRLFDARTDLEVFKQIRNCEIRPLAPLRPDVPPELIGVIERALAKDPVHRFPAARTMAFALAEILRYAPANMDAQQALGRSVAESRQRLGARAKTVDDAQPTWDYKVDKKPTKPPVSPGLPPERAPLPGRPTDSIDIEFSSPEIGVDPMLLTQRKKP
jgi:serine/threonine-protein kinase